MSNDITPLSPSDIADVPVLTGRDTKTPALNAAAFEAAHLGQDVPRAGKFIGPEASGRMSAWRSSAESAVRRYPWSAVGVTLLAGVLVGRLLRR